MACSSSGWSRHPSLNRGGRPKQRLRDRWSTGEHEAPPARPPAGTPDDDRCCHGNSDSSLQFRALTPGCLCFGSVGSVWSVRIYVKAARDGRRRLTGLPPVLASLRYLVSLLRPPKRALSRGGRIGAGRPGVGAGAFLKPRFDIGHARAETVAEFDTGRQGTTGGMAVVNRLQGKAGEFSQFGWGQQLLHVRFLGNRHMPVLGIATPMQEAKNRLAWLEVLDYRLASW